MKPDSALVQRVVPAKFFGISPHRTVTWVVLHTMECGETMAANEAVAGMFGRGDRRVSAHYCCGADGIIQCVRECDVAWAAGHTANSLGIHIELVGRAQQDEAAWDDEFSHRERAWLVQLVADICGRNGLPPDRVDVDGARVFSKGVLDHDTVRQAFRETDHTDVGQHFPWDELMIGVRATMGVD